MQEEVVTCQVKDDYRKSKTWILSARVIRHDRDSQKTRPSSLHQPWAPHWSLWQALTGWGRTPRELDYRKQTEERSARRKGRRRSRAEQGYPLKCLSFTVGRQARQSVCSRKVSRRHDSPKYSCTRCLCPTTKTASVPSSRTHSVLCVMRGRDA